MTARPRSRRIRRSLLGAGLCALLLGGSAAALADDYPSRTVTIIVPYAPGGQGDVFARLIAHRLTTTFKQAVIVENKPGATGAIGTRYVTHADPDGYTLLLGQTGEIAVSGFVSAKLGYDPIKDLRPIVLVGESPLVLVAPPSAPFSNPKELVAQAKAHPGTLNYASSGVATPGHLAAAAMALGAKIDMVHVPYKGAGQALADVLAGHVQMFFSSAAAAAPQIQDGKLKAVGVSTLKRVPTLPNVPTIAETIVPGFNYSLWGGLFAPAGTPDAVIARWNKEVNALLSDPSFRGQLEKDGVMLRTNTPAEFGAFVQEEVTKYGRLVKETGIRNQ
ncbi:MAG: Bug family tripartite tricarboxylate transporter substrate binding protein [Burkholderiaceae bacterium]